MMMIAVIMVWAGLAAAEIGLSVQSLIDAINGQPVRIVNGVLTIGGYGPIFQGFFEDGGLVLSSNVASPEAIGAGVGIEDDGLLTVSFNISTQFYDHNGWLEYESQPIFGLQDTGAGDGTYNLYAQRADLQDSNPALLELAALIYPSGTSNGTESTNSAATTLEVIRLAEEEHFFAAEPGIVLPTVIETLQGSFTDMMLESASTGKDNVALDTRNTVVWVVETHYENAATEPSFSMSAYTTVTSTILVDHTTTVTSFSSPTILISREPPPIPSTFQVSITATAATLSGAIEGVDDNVAVETPTIEELSLQIVEKNDRQEFVVPYAWPGISVNTSWIRTFGEPSKTWNWDPRVGSNIDTKTLSNTSSTYHEPFSVFFTIETVPNGPFDDTGTYIFESTTETARLTRPHVDFAVSAPTIDATAFGKTLYGYSTTFEGDDVNTEVTIRPTKLTEF